MYKITYEASILLIQLFKLLEARTYQRQPAGTVPL